MASDISLLYRLSNKIRKASQAQNMKAARAFEICDDNELNVEDFLKSQFLHIIQDRFPGTRKTLVIRLADTMLLRRKRVLYRRSRYSQKPIRILKQAKTGSTPNNPNGYYINLQSAAEDRESPSKGLAAKTPTVTASQVLSATTLAANGLRKFSTPSSDVFRADCGPH